MLESIGGWQTTPNLKAKKFASSDENLKPSKGDEAFVQKESSGLGDRFKKIKCSRNNSEDLLLSSSGLGDRIENIENLLLSEEMNLAIKNRPNEVQRVEETQENQKSSISPRVFVLEIGRAHV